MTTELIIVLGLLVAAIVMFAINRPRMDAVALIMLTLMPLLGIIPVRDALAGFADPNIVLIAALFVIGDGLVRTGVARWLGDWLSIKAGSNEVKLTALLMVVVCGLGSMMSSTAVTAIFIPVALRIAQTTGTSPGRLMMPLSFAALISGMMTLVATAPNLVVNSELQRSGLDGFRFFSFTPFGVPVLILGIGYMLIARRWLPAGDGSAGPSAAPRQTLTEWIKEYDLAAREHRLRVSEASSLVGRSLGELDLRASSGVNIIAVERRGRLSNQLIQPRPALELRAGDVLLLDVLGASVDMAAVVERFSLTPLPLASDYFSDRAQEIGLAEVIVPYGSDLVEKTVVEAGLRSRVGATVIGMRRGTKACSASLLDQRLREGDTLLMVGPWKRLERLNADDNGLQLMRLPVEVKDQLAAPGRAPLAVISLAVVLVLMITGWTPNVIAALIGCLMMGAFKCVTMTSSYRAIDWKTIVLIVGMLPFSIALQKTGGVDLGAGALNAVTSNLGVHGTLAAIFVVTATLGLFISNTATAVLMAPVAIAIAKDLGMSPYPFGMTVALAASTAFMTPVSSPVNTLVVGPGNYRFGDFVRIGVPFSIIVLLVTVLMVPWLLPPDLQAPPSILIEDPSP
ncbi:MAG: SLC13 family permease [Phycisphaeraceae bacterium]|nr:SLC13 family permease [Phycisphaeraceae bacterium]